MRQFTFNTTGRILDELRDENGLSLSRSTFLRKVRKLRLPFKKNFSSWRTCTNIEKEHIKTAILKEYGFMR